MIPMTGEQLRDAKEQAKQRYIGVALKYTPESLTLIIPRKGLSGRAWFKRKTIAVPRPFTRKSLYIFLHECAHITLEHGKNKRLHRYEEELQAEQFAHRAMRAEGIAVPLGMTRNAHAYVWKKIDKARKRGLKKRRITKAEIKFR